MSTCSRCEKPLSDADARMSFFCWACRKALKNAGTIREMYRQHHLEDLDRSQRPSQILGGTPKEMEWTGDDEQVSNWEDDDYDAG